VILKRRATKVEKGFKDLAVWQRGKDLGGKFRGHNT